MHRTDKKSKLIIILLVLLAFSRWTEAHAEEPPQFRKVLPGYEYQFPRDYFSHDDFRIEWWYYTGNLESAEGQRFGYQVTFFRVGLEGTKKIVNPSEWKVDQVYFAHMTVSDIDGRKFHFYERINRKGMNNAGAKSDRFLVWNEDWVLTERNEAHRLQAIEAGTGVDLKLMPGKPMVFHGEGGISRKGERAGNASHYFSYPRMQTTGKIFIAGKEVQVTGTSWMDREFSSDPLNPKLVGWDWFSLKLDNDTEIMLYQLRQKDGGVDPFSSGTLIAADGVSRHLQKDKFSVEVTGDWTSKKTQTTYPAGWIITLADSKTRLTVQPDLADQELTNLRSISGSYWEGSVSIEGTLEGQPVKGKGYVELVGYETPLKQELPE
ncbi:MAG: carotenoid 1,2-hydratase [Nitrospinae bacterium]|jgi:predicted secreted hydrolase|nr:carotenoid 1,2-hydratase [Nitrospinota bacterium]MDA1109643.1 carotenoid 1,2-hydratase [Nitrospinota bacterium]